jgi:hypothetical protein
MRKLLTCAVADVPPLHLNSRNDMSRAYAVRIIASPRAWRGLSVWFVPAVVSPVSAFIFHFSFIAFSNSVDKSNGTIERIFAPANP